MDIKSNISRLLRKTNLLSIAEWFRFQFQKLNYKKSNTAFKKEHSNLALPPEFFIYETYRLNYGWYYEDGKNTAEETIALISKYLELSQPGSRLLDWGCGPGRVTRHFPTLLPNTVIYGSDYNKEYIKWCKKNLPAIEFTNNNLDPPLHYGNAFFDVIIGLSVFTHLSEQNHFRWIDELFRVIKKNGVLLITTQGNAYYSKLTAAERKVFDSGSLVTRKHLNEGNRLYSSFQPAEYIRQLTRERFKTLEYIPGYFGKNEPAQDTWLFQKI